MLFLLLHGYARMRLMRATIELPDRLRAAVLAVAARKGYRGYSKVIEEALEFYLAEREAKESGLDGLLGLRGGWSKDEAREFRGRIKHARANWRDNAR